MGTDEEAKTFKCYAPVFRKNNCFACVFLALIYLFVIAYLLIVTLGLILITNKGQCIIKGLLFRIKNCCKGNTDPNLVI